METIEIETGGYTFGAIASGPADGELVMLLHGFPQTPRALSGLVEALGAAGWRAVAPELRGFGRDNRPVDVASYAQPLVAGDVLGIARELGTDSFHLFGHDLGGIVGWDLACRHPEALRTLAVASTPHLVPFAAALAEGAERRLPPFGMFRSAGVAEQVLLADDGALLRASYAGLPEDAVEEYVAHFSAPGSLTGALNHFRAFEYSDWLALPPSPVPTLFMWGEEDPYLAPATARATRDHVTGERFEEVELEGIGHWVPEAATARVGELVRTHLAG